MVFGAGLVVVVLVGAVDMRDIVENPSILRIPVFELFSGRCSAGEADLCSPDKEKTEKDVWFWVLEGHDNGCQ